MSGLLPNLAMAVRIASTVNMALTTPRLYSTSPTASFLPAPLPLSYTTRKISWWTGKPAPGAWKVAPL